VQGRAEQGHVDEIVEVHGLKRRVLTIVGKRRSLSAPSGS
jgi:hypothetical protein